jgi:hypothetical protein
VQLTWLYKYNQNPQFQALDFSIHLYSSFSLPVSQPNHQKSKPKTKSKLQKKYTMTDYEAERYEGNGGADFENQSYGAGGADSSPQPRGADDHSDSKSEV